MTVSLTRDWWDKEVWADYVDLPATAIEDQATRAAVHTGPGVGFTGSELGFEVGYVTIEFDASGHLMGDGQLYDDRGVAQGIVDRRNASEGEPELLDRWFVLPVVVDTAEASAAHLHACALRPGRRPTHTHPASTTVDPHMP